MKKTSFDVPQSRMYNAKYKSFIAQVDKSLKSFEYSTEWADLISALGRLIKVIQSNTKCGYVPRSFVIGKRLAQCLHPALPAGVHCKALECYDVIFRTIGPERVAYDLYVYGPGLFALLEPSAMTVKSPLFDIYEEHLLPLGKFFIFTTYDFHCLTSCLCEHNQKQLSNFKQIFHYTSPRPFVMGQSLAIKFFLRKLIKSVIK
ncbi:unnamed protein product [Schistosoma margrebowiei]|uniref:DOP1 N-terminal domain-containing protein n=1 Tax=Schistosoma margrebowiei TaxID=48269 RepID=A0A183LPA7_9TREM|nr:unnamed protein product [Schistosoma margrebowiei]